MSDWYKEEKKLLEPYMCDDMINIVIDYLIVKCDKCKVFNFTCSTCNELWVECWKHHCCD